MIAAPFALREDYWESFTVTQDDIEFIYNYLLEVETPLSTRDLSSVMAANRINQEKINIERKRSSGGEVYFPKDNYEVKQSLVFPAFNWAHGEVVGLREGNNPDTGVFQVIQVKFDSGEMKEFACGISEHELNNPPHIIEEQIALNLDNVLANYGDDLEEYLEEALEKNDDFVRIAAKWFPRALLVDINIGHLNLAEAILDMEGGGPLPTTSFLEQIGLTDQGNQKLIEFSLDLALQEDTRFDEVGPMGEVLWFLNRLEPEGVLKPHPCLRYNELDYDRSVLNEDMLALEKDIDDELSNISVKAAKVDHALIKLIYPHLRAGTLPMTAKARQIFPSAYEAPRIRITLVDGDSGEKFPGWVVRQHRYVYGLESWFQSKGAMPGSLIEIRKGDHAGEIIIQCESRRSSREWVRTLLVGSDGGIVYAMLKQPIGTTYDERMAIAVPDIDSLDMVWEKQQKERTPFERTVVNIVRELAKLNPQSHVHASELYAAVNTVRRCPPGPILALLASRSWFVHVGDLHYRFDDSERT
jgi:hypothetical protein